MKDHCEEMLSRPLIKTEKEMLICMSYWYPIIIKNGIKTPKTKMITLDYKKSYELFDIVDGKTNETIENLITTVLGFIKDISLPCFLRTGQTSGKHDWEETCMITNNDRDYVRNHIHSIIDFSGCFDLAIDTWVVREYLPTIPMFYAFRGMPIIKERRYFVNDGKVINHFPYWPEHAIDGNINEINYPKWRKILFESNIQTKKEINILTKLSEKATYNIKGYWSIDWIWTKNGWYCTDMALGKYSYHYGDDTNNR